MATTVRSMSLSPTFSSRTSRHQRGCGHVSTPPILPELPIWLPHPVEVKNTFGLAGTTV